MSRFDRGLTENSHDQAAAVTDQVAPVLVRYNKKQRTALKQLALDQDKPMEVLMHEALGLLLEYYGYEIPRSSRIVHIDSFDGT